MQFCFQSGSIPSTSLSGRVTIFLLCLCFTFMQFFFQSGSIPSTSLLGQVTTFLLCLCLLAPHKCMYENIYFFILFMFMFNFQKLKQVNTFFYDFFFQNIKKSACSFPALLKTQIFWDIFPCKNHHQHAYHL